MKKHNEGYTLVMVLVVMLVLTMVALAIMSFSLRNLQNQQASVERMQAKYEAQGEIEKIVGLLIADPVLPLEEGKTDQEVLAAWISSLFPDQTIVVNPGADSAWKCDVTFNAEKTAESGYKYMVYCEASISGKIENEYDNNLAKKVIGYKVSGVKIEYTTFEIGGGAA